MSFWRFISKLFLFEWLWEKAAPLPERTYDDDREDNRFGKVHTLENRINTWE